MPSSSPTCEHSVTNGSFACAAATSASRTWGVRPHTPPVSAGSPEPSTMCAASAATASWPSNATPWDPAMVPPASRMPSAGTAIPSASASPDATA